MLTWCVIGCLKWQCEGLKDAPSVAKAGETYRNEENVIGRFTAEMLVSVSDGRITATDMYAAYKEWCEINGERVISSREFGKEVKAVGYIAKKSHGIMVYRGVGLLDTRQDSLIHSPLKYTPPLESNVDKEQNEKGGSRGSVNPFHNAKSPFMKKNGGATPPTPPLSPNPNKDTGIDGGSVFDGGSQNTSTALCTPTASLTPAQIVLAHLEEENRRVSYLEGILDYSFEMVIKEILPELEESGLVVNYPSVFELELRC
jgi:hypothetical protein